MKNHPHIEHLKISSDGTKIIHQGEELKIRTSKGKNHPLQVLTINKTVRSAAKLVLETYKEKPKDGKRYYTRYKDEDKTNIHPKNLYWGTNNQEKRSFKRLSTSLCKIKEEQLQGVYDRHKKGEGLKSIAKDFGISDMSVHRAIKRFEKYQK